MEKEQFEQFQKSIKDQIGVSIEQHVNGKIRNLDKKVDDYISKDIAWKKTDEEWKKTAQPVIDTGKDALGFGRVFKYIIYTGGAFWAFLKIFNK